MKKTEKFKDKLGKLRKTEKVVEGTRRSQCEKMRGETRKYHNLQTDGLTWEGARDTCVSKKAL